MFNPTDMLNVRAAHRHLLKCDGKEGGFVSLSALQELCVTKTQLAKQARAQKWRFLGAKKDWDRAVAPIYNA